MTKGYGPHQGAFRDSQKINTGTIKSNNSIKDKSINREGGIRCATIQDWLHPDSESYRGLLAQRNATWGDIQQFTDAIYETGVFGDYETISRIVRADVSDEELAASLSETGKQLVRPLHMHHLPEALEQQIQRDTTEMGTVVAKMIPNASQLIIKLEIVKKNSCLRWHQDNYVARAITTYNNCGTEYIHHDDVDFWELNNCGNNDHIVQDPSKIESMQVGDVLLIKGKFFPAQKVNGKIFTGLVHRSPPFRYHSNGEVMTRLCLKVDVMPSTAIVDSRGLRM